MVNKKVGKISDRAEFMIRALSLAKKAADRTYPNPMVGAVIVKNGRVIGEGWHKRAGSDHAEIAALKNVSADPAGADMYVTLEPCAHYGKTPPCVDAIIKSGIKNLYAAMKDPNPLVSGRGIKALLAAGINVELGLCGDEARELNRKYIKFITTGLPYVTIKLAQSVDGKIAARDGSSKWITSDMARARARALRSAFDAVMVGSNTVKKDDPVLLGSKKNGSVFYRLVVDSALGTSRVSNLVTTAMKGPVIFAATELASPKKIASFRKIDNVDVIVLKSSGGRVPLKKLMRELGKRGLANILVEGGGELAGGIIDGSLADEFIFFIAPKILGGGFSSIKGKGVASINKAIKLENLSFKRIGEEMLVKGRICSRA